MIKHLNPFIQFIIHLNPFRIIVLPKWEEELKIVVVNRTGIRHLTDTSFVFFQEYIGIYRPECSIIK